MIAENKPISICHVAVSVCEIFGFSPDKPVHYVVCKVRRNRIRLEFKAYITVRIAFIIQIGRAMSVTYVHGNGIVHFKGINARIERKFLIFRGSFGFCGITVHSAESDGCRRKHGDNRSAYSGC